MRRLALALLSLSLLALPLSAGWDGHRGLSVSTDDDTEITDCGQIHVRYDGQSVPMLSEELPVSGLRSLKVSSSPNGGIFVRGGASSYSVTACKASALGNAHSLRAVVSGNTVSGEAPDRGDVIYFLVRAPRGADLSLDTNNGPISIRGIDGSLTARAHNGPIALKESTGDLDIGTQNGPIAFAGAGGRVKLHATNGPISLRLTGSGWNDGSLEAETQNGPLSLKLPRFYRSGVSVDSDGNAPVSCHAEGCAAAIRAMSAGNRDDDDDVRWPRHIDLGSGSRAVSVTTHNGPISIKEAQD
jgi:hypothetical protein